MNQKTWPNPPPTSPFSTLHFTSDTKRKARGATSSVSTVAAATSFSLLPDDVLLRISSTFKFHHVQSASLVCKSWSRVPAPLREAMLLMKWGKRFKQGKGGVSRNLDKALNSFLKGAARGSTLVMVDAGLLCWYMGRMEDSVELYRRAAELGDPAGQCNLAISYLKDWQEGQMTDAAVYLELASRAGENAVAHVGDVILQQHIQMTRDIIVRRANNWHSLPQSGRAA